MEDYQNRFCPPYRDGRVTYDLDAFVNESVMRFAPKPILERHRESVKTHLKLLTRPTSDFRVVYDPVGFRYTEVGEKPIFVFREGEMRDIGIAEIGFANTDIVYPEELGDDWPGVIRCNKRNERLCTILAIQGCKYNHHHSKIEKIRLITDHVIYAMQPLIEDGWKVGLAYGLYSDQIRGYGPWFHRSPVFPEQLYGTSSYFSWEHMMRRDGFYPLNTRCKHNRKLYQQAKKDRETFWPTEEPSTEEE